MFCKKTMKKISAAALSAVLGMSLSFSAVSMPEASAIGLGDVVGIGIGAAQAAQQKEQIMKEYRYLNTDEEGREMLFQKFQNDYGVNDDYELCQRFDTIMANLSAAVAEVDPSINERPYKYFISQDNSINAACGMGHVMMVNTGTFRYMNDDELAAIVGHEMGHGQKDHMIKSLSSNMDKTLLASIAVAATGGTALANVLGSLTLNQSIVHADKRKEWEADGLAFEYIVHTNYNPGACAAVMQKFIDLMGPQKQNFGEMLLNPSDHPNSEARRDKYAEKLSEYSGKHVTAKNGKVMVNGKDFVAPAPAGGMSAMERSYFVFGNLAAAYNHGQNKGDAHVENGTVMLGLQPILTPVEGDESAEVLAERLNSIK